MKRAMSFCLVSVILMLCFCTFAAAEAVETAEEPFHYIHDPAENPAAMEDVIVNPDAVYGFSPNPESKRLGDYAAYDWTDPEFVAEAKANREAYHASLYTMYDILYKMRDEGASIEEMARAVSAERNRLRLAAYDNDPEGLAIAKKSNLETYGNEEGPTADSLFEKYGSWELVIQKAFSPNAGMDAVCGLYDEYYNLYVELGMIAE
ncbi:MAG: hypothetical protein MJ142_01100 [Clostridia bacterium]|nr:hypothetical protein [Clostridia bacterium]